MKELLKHRIFIKDNEIQLILNREDYQNDNSAMDAIAENAIGGAPDSYVDKDYQVQVRFPMWKLDSSGNVVDFTDEEYETFRASIVPDIE
jgi:hypothetical protein